VRVLVGLVVAIATAIVASLLVTSIFGHHSWTSDVVISASAITGAVVGRSSIFRLRRNRRRA
jgi:ABC-type xylose transport system permease subunit